MTSAFCPGHVSCVFQPVNSFDAMSTGSRGIGIRLNKGATATVSSSPKRRLVSTASPSLTNTSRLEASR